jgi:hypothetical protein
MQFFDEPLTVFGRIENIVSDIKSSNFSNAAINARFLEKDSLDRFLNDTKNRATHQKAYMATRLLHASALTGKKLNLPAEKIVKDELKRISYDGYHNLNRLTCTHLLLGIIIEYNKTETYAVASDWADELAREIAELTAARIEKNFKKFIGQTPLEKSNRRWTITKKVLNEMLYAAELGNHKETSQEYQSEQVSYSAIQQEKARKIRRITQLEIPQLVQDVDKAGFLLKAGDITADYRMQRR